MKQLVSLVLISILASVSLVSVSFAQKSSKDKLSEKEQFKFTYGFIEANKQKMLGNYSDAIALYTKCLQINQRSAASFYELANIYSLQGDYVGAMILAKGAVKINPDNIWYQLLLADLYWQNRMLAKSAGVYKILVKSYPERIDLYYDLAVLLSASGKTKQAVKIYNKIEQKIGISELVSLEKERIYLSKGDNEKAYDELKKLINAFPYEYQYYSLLAELYILDNLYAQALEIYNKLLEIDKDNGLVHLYLAEFYRTIKDYAQSFEELKLAFASQNVAPDTKVGMLVSLIAQSYLNEEINEQSSSLPANHINTLLNILLKTHPDNLNVHILYADYLVRDDKYEQAREQLRLVTGKRKDNYLLWEQLLLIESELNDYNALYDESTEALEYFPNQSLLYLFNGIAANKLKNYAQAIKSLNKGLELIIDNIDLKKQFYTYLGEANYKNKSFRESDLAFDKLLEIEPENKYVLNNYSYYLALRGDSLLKAERMTKLCNELEPDNSTYLDTYAWVLYRLNKLQEAKKIIEKAIQKGGSKRPVIVEHYGDILYKNGETDKAIEQWNKAIKLGNGSEFLERKVNEGILIE